MATRSNVAASAFVRSFRLSLPVLAIALLLAVLLPASQASAIPSTAWSGSTSGGNFTDPANWGGSLPNANNDVQIDTQYSSFPTFTFGSAITTNTATFSGWYPYTNLLTLDLGGHEYHLASGGTSINVYASGTFAVRNGTLSGAGSAYVSGTCSVTSGGTLSLAGGLQPSGGVSVTQGSRLAASSLWSYNGALTVTDNSMVTIAGEALVGSTTVTNSSFQAGSATINGSLTVTAGAYATTGATTVDGPTLVQTGSSFSSGDFAARDSVVVRDASHLSAASMWVQNYLTVDCNSIVSIAGEATLSSGATIINNSRLEADDLTVSDVVTVDSSSIVSIAGEATLWSGATITNNSRLEADELAVSDDLTVDATSCVAVTTLLADDAEIMLSGGTIQASRRMQLDGPSSLRGHGTVFGSFRGSMASLIVSAGGTLTVGDPNSTFYTQGAVVVANGSALVLRAKAYATLGLFTDVQGATLSASNGLLLPGGSVLSARGTVSGPLSSANGSTIAATGTLALGDAGAFNGIDLDGVLQIGGNTVTLYDRNQAVLGSLTTLAGGTLLAPKGLLLREGDTIDGFGHIDANLVTQGYVYGEGPGPADALELSGYVSGRGQFGGNVIFSGTYSPGNSPASVDIENVTFADTSTLILEIGGYNVGSEYDQLNILGQGVFDGRVIIRLINGFTLRPGDSFDLVNYADASGVFDSVELQGAGNMVMDVTYDDGSVNFTAGVPEPATLALLSLGGLAMLRRRRKA